MIAGVGTDLVLISRIKKAIERERFLLRLFSEEENAFFAARNYSVQTIAGNFAVKESVVKALGRTYNWRELSVLRDETGKPYASCTGELKQCFTENGWRLTVSISHESEYAVAVAILEG